VYGRGGGKERPTRAGGKGEKYAREAQTSSEGLHFNKANERWGAVGIERPKASQEGKEKGRTEGGGRKFGEKTFESRKGSAAAPKTGRGTVYGEKCPGQGVSCRRRATWMGEVGKVGEEGNG